MPSRKNAIRREGVEPLPYGFYRGWIEFVGMGIAHPRTTDGRPYEFYTTWIGIVGADIIRPFLWYLRWSVLRAAGCRPYGFYRTLDKDRRGELCSPAGVRRTPLRILYGVVS